MHDNAKLANASLLVVNPPRSPGGTPVRLRRRTLGKALPSDPASIIAEALKKKFACRQLEDSFDKENCSSELSPFGSPEVPCVSL